MQQASQPSPYELPPPPAGEGWGGGTPRYAVIALLVLATLYAAGTAHRAWQWRDVDRLMASEGPALPEISRRLQVDRAIRGVETGDASRTDQALAVLEAGNPGDRAAAAQWRAIFACDRDGAVSGEKLRALQQAAPPVITHNFASYMNLLVRRAESGACEGLAPERLLPVLAHWMGASRQPPQTYGLRQLATQRARLHLSAGAPETTLALLPDGSRGGFEADILRIRALIAVDRKHEARDLIRRAQAADRGWYRSRTQTLAQLAAAAR